MEQITVHVPFNDDSTVILKPLGDGEKNVWVEITDKPSENVRLEDEKLFFCFQNKGRYILRPREYAYIESTSNHYSMWHPIDSSEEVRAIYMKSMGRVLSKLHEGGMKRFVRVHDSFIVNTDCIIS